MWRPGVRPCKTRGEEWYRTGRLRREEKWEMSVSVFEFSFRQSHINLLFRALAPSREAIPNGG